MTSTVTRVLLIEDNPAEATLVRLQLAGANTRNFHLTHRGSIADGLEALGRDAFDAILLDLNLPDCVNLNGLARVVERAPDTPVLMLTSNEDGATAAAAVRAGAQDYLFKSELDTPLLERAIGYAIERQGVQRALKASEERYALALAGVKDGIWDWDIAGSRHYFSDRMCEMLGYQPGELQDGVGFWDAHMHPADLDIFHRVLNAYLRGAIPQFEHEFRLRHREGYHFWVLSRGVAIWNGDGEAVRMAGSLSDISRRKAVEEQLLHDALHDELTGLPNRALFLDRVQQAMAVARRRPGHGFAVLFIDLNRFKSINDSLGHGVGNSLLKAVAHRLAHEVRAEDTLARLGGDEFAMLILGEGEAGAALDVAERVCRQMEKKFVVDGAELYSGASIGMAIWSDKYRLADEILRDADIAMYRAKRAGSAFEVFDDEMRDLVMGRQRLETELREAMEHNQFGVYYQPILSTQTGKVVSFEALLRWHHPQAGLVCPDIFIRVAEDTGLVVPIGWWVLDQACGEFSRLNRAKRDLGGISVSVNISSKIFNTANTSGQLQAILDRHGLRPALLNLEITEHALMDYQYRALAELEKLRSLSVGLHIDDFGTGYSSLSHLQKFSYNTLKIDRSFVAAMLTCPDNEAIVRSIIAMGRLLGMDVVAEGVETPEQLAWLVEMGCPLVQGFLFSEAVPCEMIQPLIEDCRIPAVA